MKKLPQQRTRNGQIFPSPRENETMYETPPAFSWLKVDGAEEYTVSVRRQGQTAPIWSGQSTQGFLVPDRIFEPGEYEWNLFSGDMERGWQRFSIAENAVRFLRPKAKDLFDAVPDMRPRHLFFAEDVAQLVLQRPEAVETLRRTIAVAYEDGIPEPPMYHRDPKALPYREYFGRYRDFCDRDLVACALGHALLGDEKAAAHAKELLLTICDWNSEGPCSLQSIWGDEVGLSHARCLPAVFDLCFDLLSPEERTFTARVVASYAEQCERLLRASDFCQNPGTSHSGRLPAYLGEAAMVLKGTGVRRDDELIRWLDYAIDVYGGIFPYFGGPDGGWAEGVFYATSYTKWFLPFFSAVERFSGVSFLKRPFYQRLIRYFQHFCPPGWEVHPFGDGYWCHPDDAEWPGFFAQNPYHIYAERFGSELLCQWSKQAQKQDVFRLHLLDVFLPEAEPDPASLAGDLSRACEFPDAGYISLHTDPAHPESELALLARASRFGSHSHSHADQGSFALLCGGTALLCPSGYFGRRFGTRHHYEWTNQTCAHNTILVNGEGQEPFSYRSTGLTLYARDDGDALRGAIDPSNAYEHVTAWTRSFELKEDQLLVTDHIELDEPGVIRWLMHTLSQPHIEGNAFSLTRNGIHMTASPIEGSLSQPETRDHFDIDLNEGEPAEYHVSMPPQYHMSWTSDKRRVHDICVRFSISR